ncbi:relaxin receptor 2-like, partial [Pecten maximus]|uniref:relaxin receptor 2-like n=1 Tax=Pecten maximus TaxID=6579 RepID=UPI0014589428
MDVFKLLSTHLTFIAIACAFHHGLSAAEKLGKWQNFVRMTKSDWNGDFTVKHSAMYAGTNNIRQKRTERGTESTSEQKCPKGRPSTSVDEFIACPMSFCQHTSYRCAIRCLGQESGDNCELYNCTWHHHCPYPSRGGKSTIPIEKVCDGVAQCTNSDDESFCVKPCPQKCMCTGLIISFISTPLSTLRSPFKKISFFINKIDPPLKLYVNFSDFSYLAIRGMNAIPDNFTRGLYNIQNLVLTENNISFVASDMFTHMSGLRSLSLSSNRITHLNGNIFNELSALRRLSLHKNRMKMLQADVFTGLSTLTHLNLGNNQIQILPADVFTGLSTLTHLNLGNNQIQILPADVFTGLSTLTHLNLGHNQIQILPAGVFIILSTLTHLYLHNNQIKVLPTDIFNELTALTYLYLDKNRIEILPANVFTGLSKLTHLFLNNNQINILPDDTFTGLYKLYQLSLVNNQIQTLPNYIFTGQSTLKDLSLGNNHIKSLPTDVFMGLHTLYYLSLSHNQIEILPGDIFSGLSVLSSILLNNNTLSIIPVLPSSVRLLDISFNSFTMLPAGIFSNCSQLNLLNIIGNKIDIQEHMFEGLDNLSTLLTDTPFMCCVKPPSVSDNRCLRDHKKLADCWFGDLSCKSEGDAISSCYTLIGSVALRTSLWVIGVCALIGNFAVMFYRLFIDTDNLTMSYSFFVLNLSLSDCLMGVYMIVIGIVDIYYNGVYAWNNQTWRRSTLCTTAGVLSSISSEMSTFLILLVTIDRVIVIMFPMSRLSKQNISWKQASVVSVCLWLISTTLAVI